MEPDLRLAEYAAQLDEELKAIEQKIYFLRFHKEEVDVADDDEDDFEVDGDDFVDEAGRLDPLEMDRRLQQEVEADKEEEQRQAALLQATTGAVDEELKTIEKKLFFLRFHKEEVADEDEDDFETDGDDFVDETDRLDLLEMVRRLRQEAEADEEEEELNSAAGSTLREASMRAESEADKAMAEVKAELEELDCDEPAAPDFDDDCDRFFAEACRHESPAAEAEVPELARVMSGTRRRLARLSREMSRLSSSEEEALVSELPLFFVSALNHIERVYRHHPETYSFDGQRPNDERAMLEHYMRHCGLPKRLHDELQQVRTWRNCSMHPPDWSLEAGRHWRAADAPGTTPGTAAPHAQDGGRRPAVAKRSRACRPSVAEAERLLESICEGLEMLGVQYSSPKPSPSPERRYGTSQAASPHTPTVEHRTPLERRGGGVVDFSPALLAAAARSKAVMVTKSKTVSD